MVSLAKCRCSLSNRCPLIECLKIDELGDEAAEALGKTLLIFDAFNEIFELSKTNEYAKKVVDAWAEGKWFTEKAQGVIKPGEEIEIIGISDTQKTVATGVEMFRKLLDSGEAGDNIGVLLRGTKKEEVERGQVLAKPGSIKPHKKFKCEVYSLSKEEGGRHTPYFANYRPQFYFRTTDVTGSITLPEGTEMVMPGDNVTLTVELLSPIAMDNNLRFAIREGGRTVGSGVVSEIIE